MASIVYITDRQMLEFHRLNGNKTMNFWRPSSIRNITNFYPGDLLFFLVKGTERGITREKGIMGYGRFKEANTMSINKTWNTFGIENGYPTKEIFKEAIIKYSKNDLKIKQVNSLYLTDCLYFQAPVYLSEIGVKISNMIESYFYLDKNDSLATSKILNKAKEVGIDSWMMMINGEEENSSIIEFDSCRHILNDIINKTYVFYKEKETLKAKKICDNMMAYLNKDGISCYKFSGRNDTFITKVDERIEIYVPLVCTNKNIKEKIELLVGYAVVLKNFIKNKNLKNYIEVTIIVEKRLNIEQQQLIHAGNVSYVYLEQ